VLRSRRSLVAVAGLWAVWASAGFNPEVTVGAGSGAVKDAEIAIDGAGNACLVFSAAGKLYFVNGFDAFATPQLIGSSDAPAAVPKEPSVATDGTGVTYVAFVERDLADMSAVVWTNNTGGRFKNPVAVSETAGPGVDRPTIAVSPTGSVLVGWSANGGAHGDDGEIFLFDGRVPPPPSRILAGSEASFAGDDGGGMHVAYIRGGDLYYSNGKGGSFAANEVRLTTSGARELRPRLAVTSNGAPIVMYLSESAGGLSLYLTDGNTRELLVAGAAFPGCGALAVGDRNVYRAVFIAPDGVWMQQGIVGAQRQRSKVCDLSGGEELVAIAVDAYGYTHLALVRAGALSYMNNAPMPIADFDLEPFMGTVPLDVQFTSKSQGHVLQHRWDFGDGKTGLDSAPLHTYTLKGTYTVTLRVTGSGGVVSEIVKTNAVTVLPKQDHFYIPDAYVYAGRQNVKLPLKVTNVLAFQGFQAAGRYNPNVMCLKPGDAFLDFAYTEVGPLRPEFVAGNQNAEEGWFTIGVIFETSFPVVGKSVPPGRRMNFLNLVADFPSKVPHRASAELRFEEDVGNPVIRNILTVLGGVSVRPELHNGQVIVIRPDVEYLGPMFLRGDANSNGAVEIADCIFTLQYLFSHGPAPRCMDSADVDDNGVVNIADAIGILAYLFSASFHPAFPFPDPGLDGTPSDLPHCVY
jgi:PKD repeat protein